MKKIRYLSQIIMAALLLLGMGSSQRAWADDDIFNPISPSEPGMATIKSNLLLEVYPVGAGSTSGGGRSTNESVYVYASPSRGYKFEAWKDRNGNLVSEEPNFYYTKRSLSDVLVAHFVYDPDSPVEPSLFNQYVRLTVEGDDGCSAYGEGRYIPETIVSLSASAHESYDFVCWQDEEGNILSEDRYFSFAMPTVPTRIRAVSRFNPLAPKEPEYSKIVRLACSEGGTFGSSMGYNTHIVKPGESLSLYAYPNYGYELVGWYLNGEIYTTLSSFTYTIGEEDVNFNAIFRFNPESPSDPPLPTLTTYSYYFMIANAAPGSTIDYSLYLMNTEIVKDIFVRVTFPAGLTVNTDNYRLSDKAVGYTVSMREAEDEISQLEEGSQLYEFSLIGGETQPGTQALLTFKVSVPEDIVTAKKQQTKINQVSMQKADGTTLTAHTRNGVIAVYKKGDANADDIVSVSDIVTMNKVNAGGNPLNFIPEVSDINGDGQITEEDVAGIVAIALNEE